MWEPEKATLDEVLANGLAICSGYIPDTIPGRYMEIWEYNGYIYAVVEGPCYVLIPIGIKW